VRRVRQPALPVPRLDHRAAGRQGGTTPAWPDNAGPAFFDHAPSNLSKQDNGSVSYLGPGDVVVINVYKDGSLYGGHALVVNDASPVTNGTVNLVSQNSGYADNSEPVVPATISKGSVSVGGGSQEWTYSTIGVVHAPASALAPAASPVVVPNSGAGVSCGGWTAFAIGVNGHLETTWQKKSGSGWSDWADLGNAGVGLR
jgi:hypothetical protein